jgi:hypothetical protein
MKNIFKQNFKAILILLGLMSVSSCVHDDNWDTPNVNCQEQNITTNATISDVLAVSPSGEIKQITTDMVFSGYVISSDEHGNFYTTLVIQDAPQNPTAGISISVDKRDMYTDFPVGKKVYVKAKGLFVGKDHEVYKLGTAYTLTYGSVGIGRISPHQAELRIIPSCDAPSEIVPKEVDMTNFTYNDINTLVKFNNVQFAQSDLCSTYAFEGVSGVNRYIEDCSSRDIILRNSGYADFAGQKIPAGNGSIVAVLSKYNSDFQLYIRDTNDVQFNDPRCDGSTADDYCIAPTEANASIADIKALTPNGNLTQITTDLVVDVVVTADDEFGNFYKKIYVQDETGGLQVGLNMTDLFRRGYKIGNKLRIKAQGLYIAKKYDEYVLGEVYNGGIGRITDDVDQDHLFVLNETVEPTTLVKNVTEFTLEDLGQLVKVENVQFKPADVNEQLAFSDSDNYPQHPKSANRYLTNCNGEQIIVRTSGYAAFADAHVPSLNGSVTGILGIYNGEYQIYIRNIQDFDIHTDRCNPEKLMESFGRVVKNDPIDLAGWTNFTEAGTRAWFGGFYGNAVNHYAEMNAYQSGESINISWLVSPMISVDSGDVLNFDTAKAYWKHDALSVWISTDFNGVDVTGATWEPLNARLAINSDPNHAWINSGDIDLSAYAGQNVYIAFKYVGGDNPSGTTTYRVDNVVIK